ncbi:MAG: hypothetical protein ABGZ36_16115 [Actinomycetota bacterium]
MEIGESIVGAYLRQIRKCHLVTFNQFVPGTQAEIDVIGVGAAGREVWLCEVTTHIRGFLLSGSVDAERNKMLAKLATLQAYAVDVFPDSTHHFEWWTPYVPVGQRTGFMDELVEEWASNRRSLRFVRNEDYTERVQELVDHAASNASITVDPAYRMLQILTRLRGGGVTLS